MISSIVKDALATELLTVRKTLDDLRSAEHLLCLVQTARIGPGSLAVVLEPTALAATLKCNADDIRSSQTRFDVPFQRRRRGVELKLHLGEPPCDVDRTLIKNIVKGQDWLKQIISSRSLTEIAKAEGIAPRRVQDIATLALLAPDIIEQVLSGTQPKALTTNYLIKNLFPALWSDQHAQFATL